MLGGQSDVILKQHEVEDAINKNNSEIDPKLEVATKSKSSTASSSNGSSGVESTVASSGSLSR